MLTSTVTWIGQLDFLSGYQSVIASHKHWKVKCKPLQLISVLRQDTIFMLQHFHILIWTMNWTDLTQNSERFENHLNLWCYDIQNCSYHEHFFACICAKDQIHGCVVMRRVVGSWMEGCWIVQPVLHKRIWLDNIWLTCFVGSLSLSLQNAWLSITWSLFVQQGQLFQSKTSRFLINKTTRLTVSYIKDVQPILKVMLPIVSSWTVFFVSQNSPLLASANNLCFP